MSDYGASTGESIDLENPLVGRKTAWGKRLLVWAIVILTVGLLIATYVEVADDKSSSTKTPGPITDQSVIQQCLLQNTGDPIYKKVETTDVGGSVLIVNATIWTGLGQIIPGADIYLNAGKIVTVGAANTRINATADRIINANGRHVTPGIVDLHSHLGVYPWPAVSASDDGNEITGPIFPQVRAFDAFNPNDWAIALTRSGGVTSSLILPGSSNLMGGEGFPVKLRGSRVQDMMYSNSPRALKMACGENPKRNYGGRQQTPMSRMGSAWLMRQRFEAAGRLVQQQNDWCANPSPTTVFPKDISLDSVASLLRGKAVLHNHCYTVCDMEMMIRLSQEFGFKITAFHHALEAYKLADVLAANNITTATFADGWGFKLEAYEASVYAPSILLQAGAPVVIKSDHPVTNARYLLHEAQKAVHYGLTPQQALSSITSVPAASIHLEGRVGSIKAGLEADLVLWDRDPFVLGAVADKVLIDGVVLVDTGSDTVTSHPSSSTTYEDLQQTNANLPCGQNSSSPTSLPCFAVSGVTVYTNAGNFTSVVVQNGTVMCVGTVSSCTPETYCASYASFTIPGGTGVLIPSLVDGLSQIGLIELPSESTAQDGTISGTGEDGSILVVHGMDGSRINSRHVYAAWAGGVGTVISPPQGNQLMGGISSAFHTCCGEVVDEVLVKRHVAVHMTVGNRAKSSGLSASYSGQLASLRNIFKKANASLSETDATLQPIIDALNGLLPVVVYADSVDLISGLVRLQADYGFHLVITGAAEAYLVADRLAAATPPIDVVLKARPFPDGFETNRFVDDAIVRLNAAGVKVGLSLGDEEYVRNLRWEAGLVNELGLPFDTALKAITSNVADMFGLPSHVGRIVAGQPANFVLLNGPAFSLQSYIKLVVSGSNVQCSPAQR